MSRDWHLMLQRSCQSWIHYVLECTQIIEITEIWVCNLVHSIILVTFFTVISTSLSFSTYMILFRNEILSSEIHIWCPNGPSKVQSILYSNVLKLLKIQGKHGCGFVSQPVDVYFMAISTPVTFTTYMELFINEILSSWDSGALPGLFYFVLKCTQIIAVCII